MRVFVAGATGVIGRPLIRQLINAGHEVAGLTRSEERAVALREAGVEPFIGDVFDLEALLGIVERAAPEVVIHQLTALPKRIDPRKIKSQLAATNRVRIEGTRNLVEAASTSGARRIVAQSVAFASRPDGDRLKTEEDELYHDAPGASVDIVRAIQSLEDTTLGEPRLEGIVLRYGYFYGPGSVYAVDGAFAEDVRRRKVPILGSGGGVFSFVHVADAAAATVLALDRGEPGVYQVVDDDPAPVAEWLPEYARILGAPSPLRVPRMVGRLIAGAYAVHLLCEQRGASNEKAKVELGFAARFPSWREGFRADLST